MNFFKCPIDVNILFDNDPDKENALRVTQNKPLETLILRAEDYRLSGRLQIDLVNTKSFKCKGIDMELEGFLECSDPKSHFPIFKKIVQHIADKDIFTEGKSFAFNFEGFPRPIETVENPFGKVRYIIRALIHRDLLPTIIKEKDIGVQLNYHRPMMPRIYRLVITCEGQARLIYQQDRREHYLNDCVVGRISIEPNSPKIKTLSISLIRKDELRLFPGNKIKEKDELIDFVNLTQDLKISGENQDGFIPFKLPLGKYKLVPTSKLHGTKILYSISYILKVRFQEENGKAWLKEIKLNIWRGK